MFEIVRIQLEYFNKTCKKYYYLLGSNGGGFAGGGGKGWYSNAAGAGTATGVAERDVSRVLIS